LSGGPTSNVDRAVTLETRRILDRLYPDSASDSGAKGPKHAKRLRRPRRGWLRRVRARLRRFSWYLGFGLLLTVGWGIAHLYYYNRLVDLEYNVQEAWAQVETQFQRRYHIQQNLTRMVLEYARHERDLMVRLTQLRMKQAPAQARAAKPTVSASRRAEAAGAQQKERETIKAIKKQLDRMSPRQLNELFPHIQFLAEQYPKLRLSENFQQFSKATIETENKIAEEIRAYNKAVNRYTTILMQFPGVVFGRTCGFKPYDFYVPDRKKLGYRPVELENQ
jgi:LemA protein